MSHLSTFHLYPTQGVVERGAEELSPSTFLEAYGAYLEELQQNKAPPSFGGYALSLHVEDLFFLAVGETRGLVKSYRPTLWIKPHTFTYSSLEKKFHSHVFGPATVSWGVTLAYPSYFLCPETHRAKKVGDEEENTKLFRTCQKWVRAHTKPTPFFIEKQRCVAPIRLGRQGDLLAKRHLQLQEKGWQVDV